MNLPAVLQMRDNQGQKFDATLTKLDDRSATFVVGGENRKVALGVLAPQWSGHYTLLWRMPPVASKNLHLGDHGPDVEWLGRQLAQLDGKAAETSKNQVFDEAMMRRVKQFQLAQGLIPDGGVGPQTMMRLSGAADLKAPKLNRGEKISMSYILDALKKSDQQRQLGTTPTLQAAQQQWLRQNGPCLFYYGLLAAALLLPGSRSAGCVHGKRATACRDRAHRPAIRRSRFRRESAPLTAPIARSITERTRQFVIRDRGDARSGQVHGDYPPPRVAQEQKAIPFDELPAPIQREIPAMTVQLHSYSNKPGEGLVYINSIRLREGDSLMPGLRLEQITPDGMIFSYKGYRFQRGIR